MSTKSRFHSEADIDGFTKYDGSITFYNFVHALLKPGMKLLDFGAGRAEWYFENASTQRRWLRDFRNCEVVVTATDIDPAVLEHPASDAQVLTKPDERLPFDDNAFDVVVCDWVFEHIDDVDLICGELQRITKPGGWICARTTNRFGYISLIASLVPNTLHTAILKYVQPDRMEQDVFPTVYRLNSVSAVRKNFRECQTYFYRSSSDPSYHFESRILYGAFLALHRIIPDIFHTTLCVFIRKAE